ncbi:NAD(P)-binding protein [Thelephora ganbajun]|uniref:NAD(P)-binding protein n=1 Tax=Thelephora ganbajun TaxID=370292 RepID=A0ACB6ZRP3_THEGA|nr:NAD(P)-binding protein [Thelephora ganbajun]
MVSVAILGAGIFAKEAHIPGLATLGDQIIVKAIYSRSEKSSRDLAAFVKTTLGSTVVDPSIYHDADPQNSIDALLARSDIDAVIVVLLITKQPEVILKALAAGKHVLSEKPIAKDVATGIDLVRKYVLEYRPKGLIWRVAENFEYEPVYREVGQLIRGGQIGRVVGFSATGFIPTSKDNKYYKTDWRTVPDLDGGVHWAAALRTILQEPLKLVSGFASLNIDWLAPLDTLTAVIQTASGAHGSFSLSFAASVQNTARFGFVILGTEGLVEITRKGSDLTLKLTKADGSVDTIEHAPRGVQLELAAFVNAIKGVDDGLGTPLSALKDVGLLQAAFESQGKLVDLQELVPEF